MATSALIDDDAEHRQAGAQLVGEQGSDRVC
jgi:hypothetical protein